MGIISGLDHFEGGGFGADVSILASATPAPNNDDVSVKENFYSMRVDFSFPTYLDMIWRVDNSSGLGGPTSSSSSSANDVEPGDPDTSEFWFEATILNNTRRNWVALLFELGFDTGVHFLHSLGTSGLDFDYPHKTPVPACNAQGQNSQSFNNPPARHLASLIEWTGGNILAGDDLRAFWHINVPDFKALEMPRESSRPNGYVFTLRITPIIP